MKKKLFFFLGFVLLVIPTGLYPTFHGVRVNGNTALSDQHLTLAELFSQAGALLNQEKYEEASRKLEMVQLRKKIELL